MRLAIDVLPDDWSTFCPRYSCLDRFHQAGDVIDRVPILGSRAAYTKQFLRDKLLDHKAYIEKHGEDMPEIDNWRWEG